MAKTTAFKKLEAKTLASRARIRSAARATAQKQQHTIVSVLSAYGLGFSKSRNFKLPTFKGVTPAATYGLVSLALAWFIKDQQFKRIAESVADGMLSISGYKAGSEGFGSVFGTGKDWMALGADQEAAPDSADSTEGWGEEIIEDTGAF